MQAVGHPKRDKPVGMRSRGRARRNRHTRGHQTEGKYVALELSDLSAPVCCDLAARPGIGARVIGLPLALREHRR